MGMLSGIKVIDMSTNVAGPGGTTLLSDHGAEVIKVERPVNGDDCRSYGPFIDGVSVADAWTNRGKKSVTVDLHDPEGIEFVKKLCKDADVFVENFRPGVMKRLGLDYEVVKAIKPDIIYLSLTAFGQEGEYAMRPGYDIIAQAMSGIVSATGEPDGAPMPYGITIGDYVGAQNVFADIMLALYHREKTGRGQYIDLSLVQGLLYMNANIHHYSVGKKKSPRTGAHNSLLAPYGIHRGKNGQFAVIAALSVKLWTALCEIIGHSELVNDPRFDTVAHRCANRSQLTAYIEEWLCGFDDINNAIQLLQEKGIPSCKVYDLEDVVNDKFFREQGWIVDMALPDGCGTNKTFVTRAPVGKFSEDSPVLHKGCVLGRYNHELMSAAGYSDEDIERLQNKWAKK
ncbi:MAG: CaiB/BaiF CoA transferase family protein [Candidatus Limivicinus sp.]